MKLYENLSSTQTEEEVKNVFAKFFDLKLSTKNYIDLYTEQILFEFKLDANLKNISTLATCLAQTLYYIRRLKFSLNGETRKITNFISVVTKNFAVIAETKNFSAFYSNKNFDWDLASSSPCKKLIKSLSENNFVKNLHVYDFAIAEDEKNFIAEIKNNFIGQTELFLNRKVIDENNFFPIFEYWQKLFGAYVENGRKSSEYFITDIEVGKTDLTFGRKSLIFRMNDGTSIEKFLPLKDYKYFWDIYEKISSPHEIISIRQKMDRMTEPKLRRFTGEFFTPMNFAHKAVDYLSRVVGENWYKSGNFRLWDMCAGTGNLEFALPAEAWKFCYISTLNQDDANYCKKIFPDATVFQYDYLNDDIKFFTDSLFEKYSERKMPKKLVEDLQNPDLKWIIFINPPYVTSNNYERDKKISKDNVSMTEIQKLMTEEKLGEVSRELYSQFLYRINLEFSKRQTYLGIFSKLKYINSTNDQKFRDKIFQYKFERGFTFSSKNFDGCKAQFPVGFLIWSLHKKISLSEQEISLDAFNENTEKYAVKSISAENRQDFLSKWIERPPATKKFPPMSSALNVNRTNKDRRDRISENFLVSLMCNGNDFMHQNRVTFLSGPYVSAGAFSVTPKNFEESMLIHAVRRIPKATWLNDRDQFMQPTKKLSREFICDCVVWSLFSNSNQTVSLRNVEYEGEIYQMKNNLFPILLEELRSWKINSELNFSSQIFTKQEDRFAAIWIKNNFSDFSAESRAVLAEGKNLYRFFYEGIFNLVELEKFQIYDWDVGWYQLKNIVKNFDEIFKIKIPLQKLGEKILPQIYKLGFLRDEVIKF